MSSAQTFRKRIEKQTQRKSKERNIKDKIITMKILKNNKKNQQSQKLKRSEKIDNT